MLLAEVENDVDLFVFVFMNVINIYIFMIFFKFNDSLKNNLDVDLNYIKYNLYVRKNIN